MKPDLFRKVILAVILFSACAAYGQSKPQDIAAHMEDVMWVHEHVASITSVEGNNLYIATWGPLS